MARGLHDRAVSDLPGVPEVVGTACPVCGGAWARPRFAIEGFASRLVECTDCGLGRLDPLPSEADLDAHYPDAYYGDPGRKFRGPVEGIVRILGTRHIRFLSRGVRPGGRLLDVGCGRGVLLSELAERGFEVHGVERSKAAAEGADPRAEIRIVSRLADAEYRDSFFDAIVIWHVLEHLREPVETVREIHRILAPGGKLVVAVPNFSSLQAKRAGAAWFHLDLPRHVFHFPLAALRRLLVESGFSIESEHHFSLRQNPFGEVQSRSNRRSDLPRNGLYTLLHERHPGDPPPFDARTRRRLVLRGLALAPLALATTVAETLWRSGATIHVVARRNAR
ncbi:putative S-adenosylmethionine-dependent methyltransferase/MSMEI_2290 [Myxococcaceae bacterium]|nr:putative S-adenosylmethionine-dependent methyltransferase/MSMEI_2290 [Myxococcaceae bacterium]